MDADEAELSSKTIEDEEKEAPCSAPTGRLLRRLADIARGGCCCCLDEEDW